VNSSIGTITLLGGGGRRWAGEPSGAGRANSGWPARTFCLADEERYNQRRAVEHEGRSVTIGPLALFSTETGDAWLLDPADHLAARLARDGDPEPIDIEETHSNFVIGWKGNYGIEGEAFVSIDRDSGRLVTILGYPADRIAKLG
jgi:hypothetical protein